MSVSEMFDRIARAIEDKSNYIISSHHAKALARTVLATLREPTKSMQTAGGMAANAHDYPAFYEDDAKEVYRAMIDAALAED